MTPYRVRDYLDADLHPFRRQIDLEALTGRFTGQPLDDTVTGLRGVLAEPIGMEDYRRLHILISHLYHACGAPIPLTATLRGEVNNALAECATTTPPYRTKGTDPHVLS